MSEGRRASERRLDREETGFNTEVDEVENPATDQQSGHSQMERTGVSERTVFTAGLVDDPERELADAIAESVEGRAIRDDTVVIKAPPKEKPLGAQILIRSGPEADKAFWLNKSPAILGRGEDAILRLEGASLSRAHCSFTFQPEEGVWIIEDLASRSGTLHNGVFLENAQPIDHGDIVHVGEYELRFLWHDEIPEQIEDAANELSGVHADSVEEHSVVFRAITQARSIATQVETTVVFAGIGDDPPPKTLWLRRFLFRFVALGLLLGLLFVVGGQLKKLWDHLQVDPEQMQMQVAALMERAQENFQARRLDDAQLELETVQSLDPDNPNARSLLRVIAGERTSQKVLEDAQAMAFEGKHDEARKHLKRIADSSLFAEGRTRLLRTLDEKERDASFEALRPLMLAGPSKARDEALLAHAARWPDDPKVKDVLEGIVKEKAVPFTPTENLGAAKRAFVGGNTEKAIRLVQGDAAQGNHPARRYLAELNVYEEKLASGLAHLKKMKSTEARADLERAQQALIRLGAKNASVPGRRIAKPLANALYLDAMRRKKQGDECAWGEAIMQAHQWSSNDTKIKAQKRAVDAKAKAGLMRARAAATGNAKKARAIAKAHQCFAEPTSKSGKALRQLAR